MEQVREMRTGVACFMRWLGAADERGGSFAPGLSSANRSLLSQNSQLEAFAVRVASATDSASCHAEGAAIAPVVGKAMNES